MAPLTALEILPASDTPEALKVQTERCPLGDIELFDPISCRLDY
jgi:hypothetical protein